MSELYEIWGPHSGEDVMLVFWTLTLCGLVGRYRTWRWGQYVPLKRWYLSTCPHDITTQKTNTVMSQLAQVIILWVCSSLTCTACLCLYIGFYFVALCYVTPFSIIHENDIKKIKCLLWKMKEKRWLKLGHIFNFQFLFRHVLKKLASKVPFLMRFIFYQ
jgi:hypothetical protein